MNELTYECIYCDFKAPTKTRLKRHLTTQKHATNVEKHHLEAETTNIVSQITEELTQPEEPKLCVNMDCERFRLIGILKKILKRRIKRISGKNVAYAMDILMIME